MKTRGGLLVERNEQIGNGDFGFRKDDHLNSVGMSQISNHIGQRLTVNIPEQELGTRQR